MTLFETVKNANIPEEDIDHHESDLYLRITAATRQIMRKFLADNNNPPQSPLTWSTFKDQQGVAWYEIPFAYIPFWEKRGTHAEGLLY